MTIKILTIGRTDNVHLQSLVTTYKMRLKHYVRLEMECIPDLKNTKKLSEKEQKEKEGALILKKIGPGDVMVLLDENGKHRTSVEFSKYLQKQMNSGIKQLVFVIGGPYGFSDAVYQHAQERSSLSKMTFSHQMVRLFLLEQIYRAFTILNKQPYHHG